MSAQAKILPVEFPQTLPCPFFKRGAVFSMASISAKAKDHIIRKAKQDLLLMLVIFPLPPQILIASTLSKWEGLNLFLQGK
jgi:hypothetical protein